MDCVFKIEVAVDLEFGLHNYKMQHGPRSILTIITAVSIVTGVSKVSKYYSCIYMLKVVSLY